MEGKAQSMPEIPCSKKQESAQKSVQTCQKDTGAGTNLEQFEIEKNVERNALLYTK